MFAKRREWKREWKWKNGEENEIKMQNVNAFKYVRKKPLSKVLFESTLRLENW